MPASPLIDPFWEVEDYYRAVINGRKLCHESWLEMRFGGKKSTDRLNHIPEEVMHQWLRPFNNDFNSLQNYAWINYYDARFELVDLPLDKLVGEVVVNSFGEALVNLRSKLEDISDFCCNKNDASHWQCNGTWTLPPVVLDVCSFRDQIPPWADISGQWQLIEGHNRLGYLKAMAQMALQGKCKVLPSHKIYLLHA